MDLVARLSQQLQDAVCIEDLRAYCDRVVVAVAELLDSGARITTIGREVALAHDALLIRMLTDAEAALGAPPCAYAWIVLGSEGRYEQTLRTDQDNALIYADAAPPEAAAYFAMLAARMVEQLVACGFPRCPGDIMATNPQWRQPLRVWRHYFQQWITVPEEEALLRAAIFFDYRSVYGTLDIERALRPIIDRARQQRLFLGLLARAALRHPPPLGIFHQLITDQSDTAHAVIDLKLRGTAPIVDLARIFALEVGCTATNTLERLRLSSSGGSLNQSDAVELAASFELISLLRLRYQYEQIQHGGSPTNQVPVAWLSRRERRDLRRALSVVKNMQRGLEVTYQATSLS